MPCHKDMQIAHEEIHVTRNQGLLTTAGREWKPSEPSERASLGLEILVPVKPSKDYSLVPWLVS